MSSQRGNAVRTRTQKYKNHHVFKNDLHDKTQNQKLINSLHISEVCQRCKQVIEWKIKYKKYKPLSQPKTCVKCQQRNIRKAYHVLCRGCALSDKVCAKCLKSADEVDIEPPLPSQEEELKLKVEMERLIKTFNERKRRAFLRYMQKGAKDNTENQEEKEVTTPDVNEDGTESAVQIAPKRIPHSRDALLKKIEELKIADGAELDADSNSEADSFYDSDESENSDLCSNFSQIKTK